MSVTARSTGTAPAWRIVVMGVVGILAVAIGVAAGTFLLTARTAAVGAGAAYVPAGAAIYAEIRLQPSDQQDAALRELLGHFPPIEGVDLDQPLHDQLTDRLDELLAGEGVEVSWSEDVAPWFDGRVAFALTEFPASAMTMPMDPMAVPEVPPTIVLLGVTDAAAAEASIDRFIAEAGDGALNFTETQHAGVTIRVAKGSDAGAYALTEDQLLIGTDVDTVKVALDTHAGGTDTLAEVADMARLAAALPSDWLAFTTFDLTGMTAAAFAGDPTVSPEVVAAFETLMEHQSLRAAIAVTASGDRLRIDAAADPPTGPLAVENAVRGLAAEVPADALYYSDAGNLGTTLAAVIEPIKELVASEPEGEEQLRLVEAALGADVEEFVSWIGDGAMVIGFDGSQPYGGMVIVPTDVEAAERRLGQLASVAGLGALDPSSGVTVTEEEVDGVTVTSIRWEDPNAMPSPMLPVPTGIVVEFAVTDARALIGIGDSFVERALGLVEADALASQARYTDAIAQVGGSDNAGVTWFDFSGTREAIEVVLGSMLPMVDPSGLYESEIKPWLEPLDRFVAVSRLEGDVLMQRAALIVE